MLQGLPGSGKSTKAKELVKNNTNTVRLNRDLLREMFYFLRKTCGKRDAGLEFRREVESLVIHSQVNMAEMFLKSGFNVVIDDTNLGTYVRARYRQLAEELKCEFSIMPMGTDIETCVERDKNRKEGSVGEQVIRNMAKQHGIGK